MVVGLQLGALVINHAMVVTTYLRLMRTHVGERENRGPNRSVVIDAINLRAHSSLGAPYCLAGATCVLDDACKELGLKNPVGTHAGTQSWWASVPAMYRRGSGRVGFIGIYQHRADHAHGHAVVVASDEDSDMNFQTIEFNTNPDGDRNGDGVYARERSAHGDARLVLKGFVDVVQWICDANGVKV